MPVKGSQSEYHKRHYEKHKEEVKRKAHERTASIRKSLADYKESLSCERCGFSHPAALQFHHRVPSEKSFAISTGITAGKSWASILAEIQKCEVLCANCHFVLHAGIA